MIFQFAAQMANYVYLICDPATKTAVVVDPCWDVDGVWSFASSIGVEIVTAAFTHRHFDHTGGTLPKSMTRGQHVTLEGLADCLRLGANVCLGADDVEATARQAGIGVESIRALQDGDTVALGAHQIGVLHTPGHTPGSVCFMLGEGPESCLITGDTLFIGSCGRSDLPESNPMQLLSSLQRLSGLHEHTVVLPGHNYAAPSNSTIGQVRAGLLWACDLRLSLCGRNDL